MRESDYYPAGAYSDPNAPYNEPVVKEREFDIDVDFTMHKIATVTTNDYIPEYDDEDGREYANTDDTNWESAYNESGHYTIPELLEELKQYILNDMETCSPNTCKGASLKRMLESCDGWEVVEKSFTY